MTAFKKKPAGPICTDCGNEPAEQIVASLNPVSYSTDRCKGCFKAWALQVLAVHRALR